MAQVTEEQFRKLFKGTLVKQGEPGYDELCQPIYNLWRDCHPLWWARVRDEDDIVLSVKFAAQNNLKVAVSTAGQHSHHSQTDGVQIDLRDWRGATVDVPNKTVTIKMGSKLSDVDNATSQFNLYAPVGVISHTGAGLLLGGGVGWNYRSCGFSVDNLISARVVLATGDVVACSDQENSDLMLSVRGGGGFTGVVVEVTMRCVERPHFWSCALAFPFSVVKPIMVAVRDFLESNDVKKDYNGTVYQVLTFGPDGNKCYILNMGYFGTQEQAEAFYAPLLKTGGHPLFRGEAPFVKIQQSLDHTSPKAAWYNGAAVVPGHMSDELLDTIYNTWEAFAEKVNAGMIIEQRGGIASELDASKTLIRVRDSDYDIAVFLGWTDAGDRENRVASARDIKHKIMKHPEVRIPTVLNYEAHDKLDAEAHVATLMKQLKEKYDPNHLFHSGFKI